MNNPTTQVKHTVTIRKAKYLLTRIFRARQVPLLLSSPGLGKTAALEQIAKEEDLAYINHVASTSEPTDVNGYPFIKDGIADFATFTNIFPTEDMEIPEGKVGWLINLDEFTSSEPDVQAAFYKVIHERKVGQRKLHPNVLIAMTGNYLTDNAVVNPLSSAIWSRIVTLHIEPNLNEWIDDYAIPSKFDPMLLGFIINNNILTDFSPSMESDRSFCCPRSWKILNDLIVKNGGYDKEMLPAYAGTITPSVAVNLDNFFSISGQIVSIQEILKDPENARIEARKNLQWATVAQIISNLNDENAIDLFTYVSRMDLSMQILMFRSAMSILPNLVTDSKFTSIIARLGREAF